MNSQKMEKLITDITDAFVLAMRAEAIPPASMARVLATVKDAVVNNVDFPDKQFALVTGSPVDGIELWGPFDDIAEANEWAETELRKMDYWVVEIKDA